MNEKAKDAAQSAADDKANARLEKDLKAVKNDIAHLSQQISEAVNALGAVAQGQARRGLRHARANVVRLVKSFTLTPRLISTSIALARPAKMHSMCSIVVAMFVSAGLGSRYCHFEVSMLSWKN